VENIEFNYVVDKLKELIELGEKNNHDVERSIELAINNLEKEFSKERVHSSIVSKYSQKILQENDPDKLLDIINEFRELSKDDMGSRVFISRLGIARARKLGVEVWGR
jgi:DNA invertase Pin-like site-specific DNA recombinase